MKKTKEEAEKTRHLIIEAAVHVFNFRGYSGTRMEDIAKTARVTRGAIYHYFNNKNDLLFAIYNENKKRWHEIMDINLNDNEDPVIQIKNGLMMIFERFEDDDHFRAIEELFIKIEFASILKRDENLRECFRSDMIENRKRILDTIKKGQDRASIRIDISPEDLAQYIMSFYIGFISLWFLKINHFSIKEKAREHIDLLLNGILK
jgi:AcrR family transcriptional regulator